MGERYLYQKCPFLKALSQEKREQFETYFRTAPDWLIDSLVVEKIKKGTTFIQCVEKPLALALNLTHIYTR